MTRSSFAGLRVESMEGKSILVGTRTDGRTVEVSGMSDGTCDQLYLASADSQSGALLRVARRPSLSLWMTCC